jgi:hypothetical protein
MQARPKGTVPDQEGSVVHLLEKYELACGILSLIDDCAGDCGLSLRQAPCVDTTRIQARSLTQHLQKHGKCSTWYKAIRKIEKAKTQVSVKAEHPFRVIML